MNQKAEKIYNIEHVDSIHIDVSNLFEAINNSPEIMEYTVAMLSSIKLSNNNRPMGPASIRNKREGVYNVGDIIMSHWQIDRCIGKGSIGSVYEAHHTGHGSLYRSAIKIINSDLLYSPIARTAEFEDISHTTIHASYGIQQELDNMVELRGTGYIVDYEDHERISYDDGSEGIIIRMELLEPLSNKLQEEQMSRNEVVRLGIDICKALEFCAKSGVIHCDIKPSNIYVTKWGGYKLGDFSASIRSDKSQEHDRMGTLKYMAPEVYQGKPFSSNIDTYSLGLVMYTMLRWNQSKNTSLDRAALPQRLSGEPLAPIPGLDKPLQAIILKACSYKPEDRFSTPTEMLNELLKLILG